MRFRKLKHNFIMFWLEYRDVFNLFFMASLVVIVPIVMFYVPHREMSHEEIMTKGIVCSLNGLVIALYFAKIIYDKRMESARIEQLDREMQILLRFRETVAEITKNHQITISEAYGYRDQHGRSERSARFSDKKSS